MLQIPRSRIENAKRAFTTRNVPADALQPVLTDSVAPRAGDLVLARVKSVGAHAQVELPSSRKARLFEGDEVILAYGNRYAPDQFEAYVPDSLEPCHMAAGGGIAAKVVNRNARMSDPSEIEPVGLFLGAGGRVLNVADFALPKIQSAARVPGIAVVGGSMNAGKTTTAASLVRGLTLAGYKVGAAKLTGTGAGNDFWHMRDAGAVAVLDFTDAGFATTFRTPLPELAESVHTLSAHLINAGAEVLVFEIADGVYQEETSWLVQSQAMRRYATGFLYAGESAASAVTGAQWLRTHASYAPLLGVSGVVSSSPLAARETMQAAQTPCFTRQDLMSPEIARRLAVPADADLPRAA